jgi:hypothetical protein
MSALPDNGIEALGELGLSWGSIKKSVSSGVHQAIAVPKALVLPTSKNIKAATGSLKVAAPVAAAVAAATFAPQLAPTAGQLTNAIINGGGQGQGQGQTQTQYYDANGNPISKGQYDALMAQYNAGQGNAPQAAAPAPAATIPATATPATTAAKAATPSRSGGGSASGSADAAAPSGGIPPLLKWGGLAFLGVKLFGVLI